MNDKVKPKGDDFLDEFFDQHGGGTEEQRAGFKHTMNMIARPITLEELKARKKKRK